MIDNRKYYDSFSKTYNKPRDRGYHALIDDLELKAVTPFCRKGRVLEAGCGSGLVLARLAEVGTEVFGVDISAGMLSHAREKGLPVSQGNLLHLPYPDDEFDAVVSFKVLAHVEPIRDAVAEMVRVVKPGGYLALEFYNPRSFRGLIKSLKPASKTSTDFTDEDIITRYDSPDKVRSYLPENVRFIGFRGIRVCTPFAGIHKIPLFSSAFRGLEFASIKSPLASLAGFLIVVMQKQ